MAKETKLKPWQKEISKDDYMKEVLAGNSRAVGQNVALGKFYRVDFANAEYAKYREARVQKKKDRMIAIKTRVAEIAFKKGVREGFKQFLESERLKKIKQAEFNKGARSAKPKQNLAEKAAKMEAKAKEFSARAAKLKAKAGK
jgi:hypothetical protein